MPDNDEIVDIYTDGACQGNPGPGGWGALLRYGETEKELSGGAAETTNNRMELSAAIEAQALAHRLAKPWSPADCCCLARRYFCGSPATSCSRWLQGSLVRESMRPATARRRSVFGGSGQVSRPVGEASSCAETRCFAIRLVPLHSPASAADWTRVRRRPDARGRHGQQCSGGIR